MKDLIAPPVVSADPLALAARIMTLRGVRQRTIVGIAGPPGTGKSTLVRRIIAELPVGIRAAVVPMDGFHFSNTVLRTLERESRKGAIDTFDSTGFAVLMERLRMRPSETVYAPDFDHGMGEPIAASIAVSEGVDIVIAEGNYLLADEPQWKRARTVIDEVWYLRTPQSTRLERLIARHIATGKSAEAAIAWANGSDENNARFIERTVTGADLIVDA